MSEMRVLFVDDEEELVSAAVERLQLRGVDAVGVTSGDEALRQISEAPFDIVVLDVKMPGLGGLEVIQRIKAEHPGLQVVLLSGHGSKEDAEEGMRLGAFSYIMKPIDTEDLLRVLRDAVHG